MAALNREFLTAFDNGLVKLDEQARIAEPHWFPCGFAWLAIKIRKNGALANTLKARGFRWDDYRKHYYFSMSSDMVKAADMWQSMNYRERCLKALAVVLKDAGFDCYVETRID